MKMTQKATAEFIQGVQTSKKFLKLEVDLLYKGQIWKEVKI